jgi:pyruvate,water dikinase
MKYIKFFNELSIKDVPLVGGKNASLGEMYQHLTKKGVNIPPGFAITADGYRYFLEKNHLNEEIKKILADLDVKNIDSLKENGTDIRELILSGGFPQDLQAEIVASYRQLGGLDVAVRSSATAEDLPDASFAGQQETYLNIRGNYHLLEAVKKCFASLFTDRAISYREDKHFNHLETALSVGVQNMVRSDQAASGVMFTIDTESGHPDIIVVNAAYGLGEYVVKGVVNPDEYYLHKPTLRLGYKSIIGKVIGSKSRKLIYSVGDNIFTQDTLVSQVEQMKFALSDDEILQLGRWGLIIDEHYQRPMDIEWAKDGQTGELFIVQARPETVQSQKNRNVIEEYILRERGKVLVQGASVGSKIGTGKVHVITDVHGISQFQAGEILVTEITDPDWEPIMKKAASIVTNSGGRTSHAAIVSRELGLPCVVGTTDGTQVLKTGEEVTVSCAEGEFGKVYQGILQFEVKRTKIDDSLKPKTQILMNIADPEVVLNYAQIPNDGVGLARLEFIINNSVKIHPLALLHFQDHCSNKKQGEDTKFSRTVCRQISELTYGYKDKQEYFVEKLSLGIGRLAAAFYPKEVILRFSDFKSNEYAGLIGGSLFEPKEENPMLGWRGAARYYDPVFRPAFDLECHAVRRVREEMGLTNLTVMVPFCRTPEEGRKVIEILKENGLIKSSKFKVQSSKLKVYVMCEIPSNVILADEFAEIFDGFSIGSNDLTQLTLGVDRDSPLVAHIYDERNEAVKKMITEVIKKAHKKGKKVGICGQAPSDFPDFAEFLIEQGIDSVSLNPDTVVSARLRFVEVEKQLKRKRKNACS